MIMKYPEKEHSPELDPSAVDVDEIIDMTPRTLQTFMNELELKGQMEEFLNRAVQSDALVAHLSYWEKWFPEGIRRKIDTAVALSHQSKEIRQDALPLDLDQKFTPEELKLLFSRKGAFQFTFGCSKGCKYCGFDAVPRVRDEANFEQMKNLLDRYGREIAGSRWMLYYASEFADSDHFADYFELMRSHGYDDPEIITAENQNEAWVNFLINSQRVRFRASFDKDGQNGLDQINASRKEIGMEVIKSHKQRKDHFQNIGVSYSPEGVSAPHGIGCIEGALITPRGIYNVAGLPVSEEFPQGQVVVPLEGISDEPVEVGQHLKQILGSCIVLRSDMPVPQTMRDKVTTLIYRRNAEYVIKTDNEGFIVEVEKLTPERKRFLYPDTTDLEELEEIYQNLKQEYLEMADIRTARNAAPHEHVVLERLRNDPAIIRFVRRYRSMGRQNFTWEGFIKLPGVPGEFKVVLIGLDQGRYGNGEKSSDILIENTTLDSAG